MDKEIELKASLLIPTFNAGGRWHDVLQSIDKQNFSFYKKIIVDSGSTDDTIKQAIEHGFEIVEIPQSQFNHGGTRQLLVDKATGSSICIFLTQDAILASTDSIKNLVSVFNDDQVGLAYGRQLPHKNAQPLEIHARLFNYPPGSIIRSFADKEKLGFKVFFCSNSFAAYRTLALMNAGNFPSDSIMGEDAIVSAKMLLKDYKIAYVADATVNHSHSYTFKDEFKRYFDTRVFHEQNKWLIENYGKPTGEGIRYIKSELKFAVKNSPLSLFNVVTSVFAKWLGYTLGKYYTAIPNGILRKLSMHKSYWK